jgi:hypothetical protein
MSKKNLLNEATIRRFMKLASLDPLTETFLPEEEEIELDAEEVIEEPPAEEVEVDVEVEETGLSVGDVEDALAAGLGAMAAELEEAIPELELNIDAGEEMDVEDDLGLDMDMGDDEEGLEAVELAGDEEVEGDEFEMAEDKPFTAKKEKPGRDKRRGAEKRGAEGTLAKTPGHGRVDYVNEEDAQAAFFASVMEKVEARLAEEKQEQLADELTERIFKRLTQKKNS